MSGSIKNPGSQRVNIYITPKQGVLDPQGKAIESSLKVIGFDGVHGIRLGKFIELNVDDPSREKLEAMCNKLLANTVIEDYRYEIVPAGK